MLHMLSSLQLNDQNNPKKQGRGKSAWEAVIGCRVCQSWSGGWVRSTAAAVSTLVITEWASVFGLVWQVSLCDHGGRSK